VRKVKRRETKPVKIGKIKIGETSPIAVEGVIKT